EDSLEVGTAIAKAAEDVGAEVTLGQLDKLMSVSTGHTGERPHRVLPEKLRRAVLAARASVFVASAPHQELGMREQLLHVVASSKGRHAHMPQIGKGAFALGMKMDYSRLESWGLAMERRLELARVVEAESDAGTKLRLTFSQDNRWSAHLGVITP